VAYEWRRWSCLAKHGGRDDLGGVISRKTGAQQWGIDPGAGSRRLKAGWGGWWGALRSVANFGWCIPRSPKDLKEKLNHEKDLCKTKQKEIAAQAKQIKDSTKQLANLKAQLTLEKATSKKKDEELATIKQELATGTEVELAAGALTKAIVELNFKNMIDNIYVCSISPRVLEKKLKTEDTNFTDRVGCLQRLMCALHALWSPSRRFDRRISSKKAEGGDRGDPIRSCPPPPPSCCLHAAGSQPGRSGCHQRRLPQAAAAGFASAF
jgi:hypothetical protein